jgi:hypothetical protein
MNRTNVAPRPNARSIRNIAGMVNGWLIAGSCDNRAPQGAEIQLSQEPKIHTIGKKHR